MFGDAGDQWQGDDEKHSGCDVDPGLNGAGVIGAGEDRGGDGNRDDGADLHAHRTQRGDARGMLQRQLNTGIAAGRVDRSPADADEEGRSREPGVRRAGRQSV